MTIVNMVGGGGSSQADWDITVSANDPRIEVAGDYGSGSTTYSKTYRLSRSNTVFAYDGKCFKMTGDLYRSSNSANFNVDSKTTYDATNISFPDINDWVSKYNIKNATGTIKGYWSTYGSPRINAYEEIMLPSEYNIRTYNVVISDGVVNITHSGGALTIILGRKNTSSSRPYGNFYPTSIDIKVI